MFYKPLLFISLLFISINTTYSSNNTKIPQPSTAELLRNAHNWLTKQAEFLTTPHYQIERSDDTPINCAHTENSISLVSRTNIALIHLRATEAYNYFTFTPSTLITPQTLEQAPPLFHLLVQLQKEFKKTKDLEIVIEGTPSYRCEHSAGQIHCIRLIH